MADKTLRNDSTENGKKIWDAVEKAASRVPEDVKKQIEERRSTTTSSDAQSKPANQS